MIEAPHDPRCREPSASSDGKIGLVIRQPIYLVGGDEFSSATAQADKRVLAMLEGPRVAVVPTAAASHRPELAAENANWANQNTGIL